MGYETGLGGDHCAHGFRATASTLLNEEGAFDGDVVEVQLAHDTPYSAFVIRWKTWSVNGRSEVNTNGDFGSCSRCSRRSQRNSADSDDLARVYRDGAARDSEMISPTVPK
jgi:hypothetical protein